MQVLRTMTTPEAVPALVTVNDYESLNACNLSDFANICV